jgi:hypothetical protein
MTINNQGNVGPLLPKNLPNTVADVNPAKKAPAAATQNAAQGGAITDRVEISRQAKTISKALNVINTLPDVRQQAIDNAVQARVVENNRVPAATLAAKLLIEGQ